MQITLEQIADQLGVSRATVSRALNAKGRTAGATRARVLAALSASNFAADPGVRELSLRSCHHIGMSLGSGNQRFGPYFTMFWRALSSVAGERGIRFSEMTEALDSYPQLPSAVLLHNTSNIDERLAQVVARGSVGVVLGHHPRAPYVVPDDVGGAEVATAYLLTLQHRRIAFVGMKSGQQSAVDRCNGYRRAIVAAGLPLEPGLELDGQFTALGGYRCTRRAWEGGLRFTALFCASDEMAIGAIGALEDLGVRVPQQVSVAGFDGLPDLPRALTTVVQPVDHIARAAIALAESLVAGESPRSVVVPLALRFGETTASFQAAA